ncbi:MAG: DUF374 domain-containing protein [Planctomycetaceae bacterium]|nr:DUF374 domain-containing protein [Planctomycetaceae bacterium]
MKVLLPVISWLAALVVVLLRLTCRYRRFGDPRAELRLASRPYVYSILHAHQIAAIIDGERGTGAMVSRSKDGGLIVPSLLARGIVPIRGSSSRKGHDKGGMTAFNALVGHVRCGRPAYLAVDGPRGPRNRIHKGIALLSQLTGAAVLNIVPLPSRRWILSGTWDRLQIPKPFTTINAYFGEPVYPREGEDVESYRERIEQALNDLERLHDPLEARQKPIAAAPARDLIPTIASGQSLA